MALTWGFFAVIDGGRTAIAEADDHEAAAADVPGAGQGDGQGKVLHFGYAITDAIMRYKWEIHGHKGELRPHWLDDVWPEWPPPDNCHPTNGRNERGEPFWSPKMFDKTKLPDFMREHPFWGLD